MSFDSAFQKVIMVEGGYSDHPSDTGGKTQFGITEAVARANGRQVGGIGIVQALGAHVPRE
jgi:lysozyme family protein